MPIGWRALCHRRDVLRLRRVELRDACDNAFIVEVDFDSRLFHDFRIEEGILLCAAAKIVPDIFVKGSDFGRRTEGRCDLFARALADLDLGKLVGFDNIAAIGDSRRAATERKEEKRSTAYFQETTIHGGHHALNFVRGKGEKNPIDF